MKLLYSYIGRLRAYTENLSALYKHIFKPASKGHRLVMPGRYLLLTIFCFILFSAARAQSAQERTDAGLANIKPLQIGDTIPEALWQMPLQVVNHPDGKDTITLNDYRRKVIILDFWATWCGSCISAFPKVRSIEKSFEKDLVVIPVTSQNHEKISVFLSTNETVKPLNIWSAVNTKQLERYFNIFTLPHYVWISNGSLASFTTAKAFEKEAVSSFLSSGETSWNEKVELDKKIPFVISLKETDFSVSSFYHKGRLEGAGKLRGMLPYGDKHTNYYFTNYTQQEIFEWFARKVCEERPDKYHEIKASPYFLERPGSKDFLDIPINCQIIIFKDASIEEVFHHWLALGGLELKNVQRGRFEVLPRDMAKRKGAAI